MRTVTFKSVLHGAATRSGLDPAVNLLADVARSLCEYLNDRLEKAWNIFDWPEWTYTEERQFRADYDAATAYAIGDEVYYAPENKYYVATVAGTGNLPTVTAFWEEATELDRYVAHSQAWEARTIGEVAGVYYDDPRKTGNPRPVKYWLGPEGILVEAAAPTKVWVEFRSECPVFTTTAWATAADYTIGDIVYLSTTGQCYRALVDGSANNPASSPTAWVVVPFPKILARYVKEAVKADALREDESMDKANLIEGIAEGYLYEEIDRARNNARENRTFSVRNS